jgi:hypothetical protein
MADYHGLTQAVSIGWESGLRVAGQGGTSHFHRVSNFKDYGVERIESILGGGSAGWYTPDNPQAGGGWTEFGFDTELRARSVVDDPPQEGALFRAAGATEAQTGITAHKLTSYQFTDPHFIGNANGGLDPVQLMTINIDTFQYLVINAVVSALQIECVPAKIPVCHWKFLGQVAAAKTLVLRGETQIPPALSFVAGNRGVPFQSEALTLTGHTGTLTGIEKITFDLNPQIDLRPDANSNGGRGIPAINGWDPRLGIVLEKTLLATFDPQSQYLSNTEGTASWLHNAGAPEALKLTSTFVGKHFKYPAPIDSKGTLKWDLEYCQSPGAAGFLMAWS